MLGNFGDLFSKMQEMQDKLKQMREDLKKETTQVEVGAGMVKMTINGNMQIQDIQISDEAMQDKEMLEDLLIAAFNEAQRKMSEIVKEKTVQMQQNLLPGVDINDILNKLQ